MLLTFGRLRPYKGVETLIEAFRQHTGPSPILVIAGLPLDEAYGRSLETLCAGNPRIRLFARFIPESELELLIAASDLVVVAHNKLNNSGVALMALSSDRPILAPARGAILDYAETPGVPWVTIFDQKLGPAAIATSIARCSSIPPGAAPDLSFCDAEVVGCGFRALYGSMTARRVPTAAPLCAAGSEPAPSGLDPIG